MSMHNIEEHVLTIANKYIQKEYFTLSENKLKQQFFHCVNFQCNLLRKKKGQMV